MEFANPEFDRVTGMLEMSEGSSSAFRKKLADSLYAMAFADGGCKVSRWMYFIIKQSLTMRLIM